MAENANIPYASKPARKKREQKGEPFVWLSGGAIMTGMVLIVCVIALIVYEGSRTFWPRDIEVIAMGEARYWLVTQDGRQACLDAEDKLLFAKDGGYVYADGKAYAGTTPPRKATIADYRRDAKAFAGAQFRLVGAEGELKDKSGALVSPEAYLKGAKEFASPYTVADENGKFVAVEQALGDDKFRDHVMLLGAVRADRRLDLRDLPRKRDGTPWQAYEIKTDPTELLVRQGNKGENLQPDSAYFRWVKSDVPDVDGYRRGNPGGYEAYVLGRAQVNKVCEIERLEKGVLIGYVIEVRDGEKPLATLEKDGLDRVWEVFIEQQKAMHAEYLRRVAIEKDDIGEVNYEIKQLALKVARIRHDYRKSGEMVTAIERLEETYTAWSRLDPLARPGLKAEEYKVLCAKWREAFSESLKAWDKDAARFQFDEDQREELATARAAQEKRADFQSGPYSELRIDVNRLREHEKTVTYKLRALDGKTAVLPVAQVVRAILPNELGFFGKLSVYGSRFAEFLWDNPRESNTEGGIFPVIVGTLLMTLLMCLAVVPFGVIAALYLREYAKQGPLVSAVRIAVNNLAGVPSIVFGIFGLGFFCVIMGGSIDSFFYPERLPSPTFGGGGILWASLTLALMTVPVVIVATEEALIAVPSSQREASLAAGASRFQTVWRVILPQAMPGILTGTILAMARGAGEVAPLMLVGVVKLAETLPVDGNFPFIHLERKFLHLGFHIYDVGFQSPDIDNTKPLVFTTTLVLILLIAVLNIAAIRLRNKLRKRLASSHV
ncbi:Phosphate transport system permease protein PstA [Planctomycetaceae bacterium]|nr:Phosphate transport system permease protein PstA [Planctomycetaceae bacterium]